jgi:hypothetical protein
LARDSGDCPAGATQCSKGIDVHTISQFLNGNYVRFEADLSCTTDSPNISWWNNDYGVHVFDLMVNAYNDSLIPVVLFNQQCSRSTTDWIAQMQNFVQSLSSEPGMPNPLPQTYFEIINEPDRTLGSNFGSTYYDIYAAAAQALVPAVQNYNTGHGAIRGRILTGGVDVPTDNTSTCVNPDGDIQIMDDAMYYAQYVSENGLAPVGQQFLGVSIHPYTYTTPYSLSSTPKIWVNYGQDHATGNPCLQLDQTLSLWVDYGYIYNMPLFITETNVSTESTVLDCNASPLRSTIDTNREGEYLVDLFTWLHDFGGYGSSGPYTNAGNSPVRVMWFTGVNFSQLWSNNVGSNNGKPGGPGKWYWCSNLAPSNQSPFPKFPEVNTLGLYDENGNEKATSIVANVGNPNNGPGLYCPNIPGNGQNTAGIGGRNTNLSYMYANVIPTSCY